MTNKALKFDGEKAGLDLIPVGAKKAIAEVFDFGAKKYARHNWRSGFNYSRLIAAAERHLDAFNDGEDLDPESGKPHLAHLGCCVMMLLESTIKGYGTDDRYKPNLVETPTGNTGMPGGLHFPGNEFKRIDMENVKEVGKTTLNNVYGIEVGPPEAITAQAEPTIAVGAWKPSDTSTSDHNVIAAQLGGLNESAKKIESWLQRKMKETIK